MWVLPDWISAISLDEAVNLAGLVLAIWMISLMLMALNRPILRWLSGYYVRSLYEGVNALAAKRNRFEAKYGETLRLQERVDAARAAGTPIPDRPETHGRLLAEAVQNYPDRPALFLPTGFGNAYRAMEVYPRAVYGLDAVESWARMEAVLPADYRKLIAEAQSGLNFAANIYLISWIALIAYLGYCLVYRDTPSIWLLAGLVIVLGLSWRATRAAIHRFGSYVSGAYDLYRGKLAEALGLDMPRNPAAERQMWTEVSRVFILRSAPAYDRLTSFKKRH